MNGTAIRIQGLSKRYRIGRSRMRDNTLRDEIASSLSRMLHRRGGDESDERTVWSLKDVSFDVHRGDVVGLIGRNGAGKSTLLKVLSRITDPTEGRVELRGRVGSLLEVGTGFHAELTGRENVYLNGAILGMRRSEILRKFDEIVAFSEIERFIDTPVKRYSTGMYLRLAFAVAAHLEPEILLVDEVLAVGDASFQRKCLDKMRDIGNEGRTVVLVSHNLTALSSLCSVGVLLDRGHLVATGPMDEVTQRYLDTLAERETVVLADRTDRIGGDRLRFTGISLEDRHGNPTGFLRTGHEGRIVLHYEGLGVGFRDVFVAIHVASDAGQLLCTLESGDVGQNFDWIPSTGRFTCTIPRVPLRPGTYLLWIHVNAEGRSVVDEVQEAARIAVEEGDYFGAGKAVSSGVFVADHSWALGQEEPRREGMTEVRRAGTT